jgi:DNA invertase Pin-like site-specific DNA recombinase
MSDAILSPYHVQNEQTFQDLVNLQIGLRTSKEGMKQHSNVAVYLRCSTDDQSVDAQRMSLNPFLQMNGFNIDECELYIDEGVSAKKFPSFTDRPEGSRLMKDIEDGKIEHLFGFKVDRFFRRMEQGSAWMNVMARKHNNVKVVTSDCQAPLNTSAGRKWWHFSLLLAEDENEARAERTTGGMMYKTEKLEKTSHAVFGWSEYDSGEINMTQGRDVGALIKMKPCWHEYAVRQWMIEELGNLSAGEIARKLNGWRIPTATGRDWSQSSVRSQVKRPAKLHEQIHQFDIPSLIKPPFRTFKPATRF